MAEEELEEGFEEEEEGEGKKKGKSKLIIILLVALVVLGGGGFAAYKFLFSSPDKPAVAEGTEGGPVVEGTGGPGRGGRTAGGGERLRSILWIPLSSTWPTRWATVT